MIEKKEIKKIHIIVASLLIILLSNYFIQLEQKNEVEAVDTEYEVGIVRVACLGRYGNIIPFLRKCGFIAEAISYPELLDASFPDQYDVLLCLGWYHEENNPDAPTSSSLNRTYLKALVDFSSHGKGIWVENYFAYYQPYYIDLWKGLLGINLGQGDFHSRDHYYSKDISDSTVKINEIAISSVSRGMTTRFALHSNNAIYASELLGAKPLIDDHNIATWYVNSTFDSRSIMWGFPFISQLNAHVLNPDEAYRNNNMIFIRNVIMWLGKFDNSVQVYFPAHFDLWGGKEYNQTFIYTRHDYLVPGTGWGTEWGYLSNKTIWDYPIPMSAALEEEDAKFDTQEGYEFYRDLLGNFSVEILDHTVGHETTSDQSYNIYAFSKVLDDWYETFGYYLTGLIIPYFSYNPDRATFDYLYDEYGLYYLLHSGNYGYARMCYDSPNLVQIPNLEIWDELGGSDYAAGGFIFDLELAKASLYRNNRLFAITATMVHPGSIVNSYSNISQFFYHLMHEFSFKDQVWFTTASECAYLWRAILGLYSPGSSIQGTFDGSTYALEINVGQSAYPIYGLPISISNGTIASATLNGNQVYTVFDKTVILNGLEPNTQYILQINTGKPYAPTILGPLRIADNSYAVLGELSGVKTTWDGSTKTLVSTVYSIPGLNSSIRYLLPIGNIFSEDFEVSCNGTYTKNWNQANNILTLSFIPSTSTQIDITLSRLIGNLQVVVTDGEGNPVKDATVMSIKQPDDQAQLSGTTDLNGEINFQHIYTSHNKDYVIKASKYSYTDEIFSTTVRKGKTTAIRIELIAMLPENGGVVIISEQPLFFLAFALMLIILSLAFYLYTTRRKRIL